MANIAAALQRIKQDPRSAMDSAVAQDVCRELGLQWRQTTLTPPFTLALLARQVLAGNVSNPELVRLAEVPVTSEAYCLAKGRLPLEAVREMSRRVCEAVERSTDDASDYLWKGHRIWHVDGSSFSMPDTPALKKHFGQPGQQKRGCGFPVAHLLCLFNARTGLIREAVASPLRTHDLRHVAKVHPHLRAGDVLIGDTAFDSYVHLASLQKQGVLAIFPIHQRRIVSFRAGRRHARPGQSKGQPTSRWRGKLGKTDQLVEYFKPGVRPQWMTPQQYDSVEGSIVVREIRRTIRRKGFRPRTVVVLTTLLDAEFYPAEAIIELLGERWDVETNLRYLKTTMGMEVLRCKSVEGVQRELWAFALVYNLVRIIMLEAARQQAVNLDRISFADALYWLRHARPGEELPDLIVNPHRPDRIEPRAIKRRPKEYDRINKPRAIMQKALKKKR